MKDSVVGRNAMIKHKGQFYTGNVIDASPDNHAKRIRIQSKGKMQGEVLMPADYVLVEFV